MMVSLQEISYLIIIFYINFTYLAYNKSGDPAIPIEKVWIGVLGFNLLIIEQIREESNPPESKKAIGTSAISLF